MFNIIKKKDRWPSRWGQARKREKKASVQVGFE